MAELMRLYVKSKPSLSEFLSICDAVGGWDLLEGERIKGSDGSLEGGWIDEAIQR